MSEGMRYLMRMILAALVGWVGFVFLAGYAAHVDQKLWWAGPLFFVSLIMAAACFLATFVLGMAALDE